MTSLASIIITDIAPPSEVAILRSYVDVAAVTGLSLGGPLGGFLTGSIGWRWSFLCQIPIAASCCALIHWILQGSLNHSNSRDSGGRDTKKDLEPDFSIPNFDFPGAISLASAVSCCLVVIDLKRTLSWTQISVISIASVGTFSLIVFLFVENYSGQRKPLIPIWFLRTEVSRFCGAQVLILGGRHAFVSHIAPYFTRTQGLSDAAAGSYIIPTCIGDAIGALVAGQIIKLMGSYKKLSLVSMFLSIAVSILILLRWFKPIGSLEASLATFPAGFFTGMISSTQFIGLSITTPKQHMATSITIYYMSQQIGNATGISVSSGLLQMRFRKTLEEVLSDVVGSEGVTYALS